MSDPLEENERPVDEIDHALARGFTPGRWWLAASLDGTVLAETSDPSEFKGLGLLDRPDVRFYHQYVRSEEEWIKVDLVETSFSQPDNNKEK